jgi:hypothetical protein
MATKERTFADGFIFRRNASAPDYVVGNLSLAVDDVLAFMQEHKTQDEKGNEWVNVSILESRKGGYYVELDTWERDKAAKKKEDSASETPTPSQDDDDGDDLPF